MKRNQTQKAKVSDLSAPSTQPSDSTTEDQRQTRIAEITAELQTRHQFINMVNTFKGGYDGFIHETIKLEGRVEGLKESLKYQPSPTPPSVQEAPADALPMDES